MIPSPDPLRPYVALASTLLGVLFVAGAIWLGHALTDRHYQTVLAQRDALDAQRAKARVDAVRAREANHAAAIAAISQKHLEELRNVHARTQSTIDDLRAGTIRLRQQFAAHRASVPGPSSASALPDSTNDAGLRIEDAEFLVREADRADAVVLELNACNQGRIADRQALAED